MKGMNILRMAICVSIIALLFSCTKDDEEILPTDDRSFITDATTDYFINIDGSINLSVSGTFSKEDEFGARIEKGFVFGTASKPEVGTNNTVILEGSSSAATGYIKNLPSGKSYFIRGYFKYDDGTFFYGDEIEVSADIDASAEREVTLTIESSAYLIQLDFVTVNLNINNIIKEMPIEIGVEYSEDNDFSNSSRNKADYFDGAHNKGEIVVKSYQAVAEPLESGTTYYFRPYAKYADGKVSNGGTSSATFTTVSID